MPARQAILSPGVRRQTITTNSKTVKKRKTGRKRSWKNQTAQIGPQRCPQCYCDLSHLGPVAESVVQATEIVARSNLDGREMTSSEVAEVLSTPDHPVTESAASTRLRKATQIGLLQRSRKTVYTTGGYRFVYRARREALAYVFSQALALDLAAYFERFASSLQATATTQRR